jgi:hypothetical protein
MRVFAGPFVKGAGMNASPPDYAPFVGGAFLVVMILVGLAFLVLTIVIWCMIFKRAGYPSLLGLLMFVPLANFVMLLILAFSKWPVQRELEAYKHAAPADR